MRDETGREDKPFVGKRGPRKTKPKGSKQKPEDSVVRELFTEERRAAPGARSQPSKKRKRVRMGYTWTGALEHMKAEGLTMKEFVEQLTPEELARGQLRQPDGSFSGRPPSWVPAEFHKECVRELMRRGKQLYQENYIQAIESMTKIANSPAVEPAQRIKAAQFVIERIEGKVPERLEVGVDAPWQQLLAGIVAELPADAAVPVRPFHEATEGGSAPEDADG